MSVLHLFSLAAILVAMGYALKKEDLSPSVHRLFSKNSHQGFRRFFRPLRRGVGVRSGRGHWGNRVFCGKLVLAALDHGIWGSGDLKSTDHTWAKFMPQFNDKKQYQIEVVDYSVKGLNAASFDHPDTRILLENKIAKALRSLRKQKIAAQKVDVVVHSMGGLVVRSFCAKYPTVCKKNIRKLVTIDTPHYGSELADWLLLHELDPGVFYKKLQIVDYSEEERKEQRDECDAKIDAFITGGPALPSLGRFSPSVPDKHPVGGAVMSLATGMVNSPIPPAGAWEKLSDKANEVPTHALVGRLPFLLKPWGPMWWLKNRLLKTCGLSFDKVFKQDSDGVVSVGSQADDIQAYTTPIGGVDHLNVTDSEDVVKRVKELLEDGMGLFVPAASP